MRKKLAKLEVKEYKMYCNLVFNFVFFVCFVVRKIKTKRLNHLEFTIVDLLFTIWKKKFDGVGSFGYY